MKRFMIGSRWVGSGERCFLIAEAGSNHNGSLEQAKCLIDVAAEAKADAVKFQLFRAAKLYSRHAGTSDYLKRDRPIYEMIADMELPYEWLPLLSDYCRTRGVIFLSSAFDEDSADQLEPFLPAYKIASYELTHLPLVEHIARKRKPIILSTGTATFEEVRETVAAIRAAGNDQVALLQCTASYPAPAESLNLRVLQTLARTFEVPVGLSDHSRDPLVGPLGAVALGASIIEKHVTLDNDSPGPDHRFAIEPDELRLMVTNIRELERALGHGEKVVHPVEQELRRFARRSIFAIRPIQAGERLDRDSIAVLRCGTLGYGLHPREFPALLGRRTVRALDEGELLGAGDVR